jgi:hypothetical protein
MIRDMKDLKVGATYKVVTPYCVYSALTLHIILAHELVFIDINSDECDTITIPAKYIEVINKL